MCSMSLDLCSCGSFDHEMTPATLSAPASMLQGPVTRCQIGLNLETKQVADRDTCDHLHPDEFVNFWNCYKLPHRHMCKHTAPTTGLVSSDNILQESVDKFSCQAQRILEISGNHDWKLHANMLHLEWKLHL